MKNEDELKELLKELPDRTRVLLAEYAAQKFLDGVEAGKKENQVHT
jgi:hypothetical protein